MKVKVQTLDGGKAGSDIELNDEVFGVEPRADILHRVVTWQLEKRRGTARGARERSDVARTGKKFGRQKGGGTARHGDRRAPIFIGGGKAHGPRVRDFDPSLNKKVRALGLKMALSAKAKGGNLVVLDSLDLKEAKTASLKAQLGQAGLRQDGAGDRRRRAQRRLRPGLVEPRRDRPAPGGRRQRLRHSQSRDPGADPRRGREAGGAVSMAKKPRSRPAGRHQPL